MRAWVSQPKDPSIDQSVGIAAIGYYRPGWSLPNAWFQPRMPRKFAQHTGIEARSIAEEDEVVLAGKAVADLAQQVSLDPNDCAGLILACPSLIPQSVARRYLDREQVKREQPMRVARTLASRLGIAAERALGINSFCSGYARALTLVSSKFLAQRSLKPNEYLLVVTSTRISRINDFGCQQSGALFGDMATATLIARCDSPRFPVQFELVDAAYRKQPSAKPYFDFTLRSQVLVPTRDGRQGFDANRLVFSLDGLGIAETAPRAMASEAAAMVRQHQLDPHAIDFVVPHQAGASIVRFTQMKLEELGVSAEVVNGMTHEIGNVSSSSVPYTLKQRWSSLYGNILCPVAAVGAPGKREVSQGCILLRARRRQGSQAA
jgi:3-oxoacyl-[acyl-carrier-protein] synthase-3